MSLRFTLIGAIYGALGVALGAFGAHGLHGRLEPRDLEVFETAVRYQLFHAVALIGVGLLCAQLRTTDRATAVGAADLAGWLLTIGVAIFSGSLYLLVATGVRKLGMVTPLGGLALIAGWVSLAVAAWRAG